jgi:UDP:flavonoid glycosyltransferase YjiC (YdhE family)
LPLDASAFEIRAAIERVLNDPSFANAARPFRDEYDPTAKRTITIAELEAL